MPKLKYKKGDYKHFVALEALSGHQVRIRSGGTTYGIPLTTSTTVVPATWNDASETDPGVDRFRTHISLKTPAGVRHLRAEANHTNVGHSDIPHTDSYPHTDSHSNVAHSDWGNQPVWNNYGVFHSDTTVGSLVEENYHFNYSGGWRVDSLTDMQHSDGYIDPEHYADWSDSTKSQFGISHTDGAGVGGHGDYTDYGFGTVKTGSAHYDHSDYSDAAHSNWTNSWSDHSNIGHSDAAHTNWYDSVKEAI